MRLFKSSDDAYNQAKKCLFNAFRQINSDYINLDVFSIPFSFKSVDLELDIMDSGKITRLGIFQNPKIKIVQLTYSGGAQIRNHTHYDYWEYSYIIKGTFRGVKGKEYKQGDTKLFDGFYPHSFLSTEEDSIMLILHTKDKSLANRRMLVKYAKHLLH